MGAVLIAITWVYLLSTSTAALFSTLISVDGLLYAGFYILTALAVIAYYRRRIISNGWDALLAGVLPAAAIGFLAWIIVRTVQTAPASARWSLVGIAGAGLLVMALVRVIMRPPYFQTPRESWGEQ
jgi:hypothetical protein